MLKLSPIVITSPAKTATALPVSVSFGVPAVEARLALLAAPVVDTVTAFPTIAFTQVLAKASEVEMRVLVSVHRMAPGVAPMVSTLPTRVVPPVRPVQDNADE